MRFSHNIFRQCAVVKHIPDVAKGIRKNSEFIRLPKQVNQVKQTLERLRKIRQTRKTKLDISSEKVLGQVRSLRHDVNTLIDNLEANTVAELDELKSSLEKQIQKDVDIITDTRKELMTIMDDIKESRDKNESSSFIGFKKCKDILTEARSTIQSMEMATEVQPVFQPYTGILDHLSSLTNLGELLSLPGPDHMFVKESETHYNASNGDEHNCNITDICVFPTGTALLADCHNISLKLLNDELTIISSHNLQKDPVSLCYVGNSEVAVALINGSKEESTIQYIRVTDGSFNYTEARELDHFCNSMACHGGRLFVLSNDALYLYPTRRSEGRVLHKLNNSDKYIKCCAVSPDGTKIFITHVNDNTLTTLNSDGTVLHTFTDPEMQAPAALHVSPAGHVFVGCMDGTVLQVSSDGSRALTTIVGRDLTPISTILAGGERERSPVSSVGYNTNTGDLVIGLGGGKHITVIKLK